MRTNLNLLIGTIYIYMCFYYYFVLCYLSTDVIFRICVLFLPVVFVSFIMSCIMFVCSWSDDPNYVPNCSMFSQSVAKI